MSYTFDDLKGVDAMMPPFTTPDAHDIRAKNTIDVDNLAEGVDQIVRDGVQVISTCSGSGEGWNMLWEEFKTQTRATLEQLSGQMGSLNRRAEDARQNELSRSLRLTYITLGALRAQAGPEIQVEAEALQARIEEILDEMERGGKAEKPQ